MCSFNFRFVHHCLFFQLLEKAQVQLASFLDEPAYESEHAVQVEVVKTLGRCGPNAEPVFRDQCKSLCACMHVQEECTFCHISAEKSRLGVGSFKNITFCSTHEGEW